MDKKDAIRALEEQLETSKKRELYNVNKPKYDSYNCVPFSVTLQDRIKSLQYALNDLSDKDDLLKDCLEAIEELNGEFQGGWEDLIERLKIRLS